MRRNIGFHEMVFNELGKDRLSEFDYEKPSKWQTVHRDPMQPNWIQDINSHKYMLVHIDLAQLDNHFELVDDKTFKILKEYYCLESYEQVIDKAVIESPLMSID